MNAKLDLLSNSEINDFYLKNNIEPEDMEFMRSFMVDLLIKVEDTYPFDYYKDNIKNKICPLLNKTMDKTDIKNHFEFCFFYAHEKYRVSEKIKGVEIDPFISFFEKEFYFNKSFDLKKTYMLLDASLDWSSPKTKDNLVLLWMVGKMFYP